MKTKILLFPLITIMSFASVFAEVDDTQILDELNNGNTEEVEAQSLQFKSFESCEDLEKVTNDFLKTYKSQYSYYRGGGIIDKGISIDVMESDASDVPLGDLLGGLSDSSTASKAKDFSGTNEQVSGVSESEIIKTDGDYIYYMSDYYDNSLTDYNERQKKNVYVIDANSMKVVKKIKLPKHFWGAQLYLEGDKLVILASGRPAGKFQKQYWDNSSKTYSIIYDISTPSEAKLLKAFITEGSFSQSRLIGDKLYVISRKDTYNIFNRYTEDTPLTSKDIIPKGLEITATEVEDEKNVEIGGEKRDYKVNSGFVSRCKDIEYILPDGDANFGYPQFNLISIIDINDVNEEADTKVVFGNLNEIYMSLDNLYMTNSVYKSQPFRCGPGMRCISPFYYGGTNHTLIHKMAVDDGTLKYKTSALVEGSPLTQYSMDEYKGDFRILTKTNNWNSDGQEAHTDLYVLDENLDLKSSLQNLGAGEEFKSSRYIGDKLFLVTFEQIDPLFVIDLKDAENPKIIGELKMPGYSTYLHPYDENHLIGIGYDTKQNKWGGTFNNGLKVDLYEIDYERKPESKDNTGDIYVAQKYTHTFGGYGSSSEALYNPRMFMWNEKENTLLLPATIKNSAEDDQYRSIDFFQGLVSLSINKNTGIDENYRLTHIDASNIEAERLEECAKYTQKQEESECKILLDGTKYCPVQNRYVPTYCYADSTVGEYMASKSWNYSKSFIQRALWIDDTVYTISNDQVRSSDFDTGNKLESVRLR